MEPIQDIFKCCSDNRPAEPSGYTSTVLDSYCVTEVLASCPQRRYTTSAVGTRSLKDPRIDQLQFPLSVDCFLSYKATCTHLRFGETYFLHLQS
jgi:hypothetical protein